MLERMTPESRKIIELSLREALRFGHSDIRPEHLLLAMISSGTGMTGEVLGLHKGLRLEILGKIEEELRAKQEREFEEKVAAQELKLTPKQLTELVAEIQRALLQQAGRNIRGHVRITGSTELICCGSRMVYAEFLGIRRYRCTYRPGHPARYIRISDGEMVREENLDLG